MNELQVINHKGTQVVDSREVAEMVGKEHKNLLRDINGYIETMKNAGNLNDEHSNGGQLKFEPSDFFIESTYTNEKGLRHGSEQNDRRKGRAVHSRLCDGI